ncbi:MAG: NAD-dependent protein deacylase [Gammaproteobacteria bacterium]|nr:NAD-dependent protein deacylase [Gammaproteobacteria bacterium]
MNTVRSVVVLTGAGVSAESGIRTFRAADGLWEEHRVEDVATPEAFERDPELVLRFYNERRRPLLENSVQPNTAHHALARFEHQFDGEFLLVTQNIDNLHEQAGSRSLLHMHCEVLKMRCTDSDQVFECMTDIEPDDPCACCNKTGTLRPHIVWFGEMPLYMDEIYTALARCDLFIAIGTSGNVYPAAGFVQAAAMGGARTVEINLEQSQVATEFDEGVYGLAGEVLSPWLDQLLESAGASAEPEPDASRG